MSKRERDRLIMLRRSVEKKLREHLPAPRGSYHHGYVAACRTIRAQVMKLLRDNP